MQAQRAIQLQPQARAEARRQRGAGQVIQRADLGEAALLQALHGFRLQPQPRQGQVAQGFAGVAGRSDGKTAMPRQGMRRADGVGDGGARLEAEALQPPQQIAAQLRFAAAKMGAAGDVQCQAVGRREAHQRRVAAAPVRQRRQ